MEAKEMFGKLGYDMYSHKDYSIEYVDWEYDKHIWFHLHYKTIEISEFDINIKELQAINKQVEELGWK